MLAAAMLFHNETTTGGVKRQLNGQWPTHPGYTCQECDQKKKKQPKTLNNFICYLILFIIQPINTTRKPEKLKKLRERDAVYKLNMKAISQLVKNLPYLTPLLLFFASSICQSGRIARCKRVFQIHSHPRRVVSFGSWGISCACRVLWVLKSENCVMCFLKAV